MHNLIIYFLLMIVTGEIITIQSLPQQTRTPTPSATPIAITTESPTQSPTPSPIESPTTEPTPKPSDSPTPLATIYKSPSPSPLRTFTTSPRPTTSPSNSPSPRANPTLSPTIVPTVSPTPLVVITAYTLAQINELINKYAGQYGVSPDVIRHIARCESNYRANAVNLNYHGLFQFGPAAWTNYRTKMGKSTNQSLRINAPDAIETAAYVLSINHGYIWPNCLP